MPKATALPIQGFKAAVSAERVADTVANLFEAAGAKVTRFEQGPRLSERAVEGWLSELIAGEVTDVVLFSAQGIRMTYELARQLGREGAALEALRRQYPSLPVVVYTSLAPAGIKANVRHAQ